MNMINVECEHCKQMFMIDEKEYKDNFCCAGLSNACGCMGEPIEPFLCCQECANEFYAKLGYTIVEPEKQSIVTASIEIPEGLNITQADLQQVADDILDNMLYIHKGICPVCKKDYDKDYLLEWRMCCPCYADMVE